MAMSGMFRNVILACCLLLTTVSVFADDQTYTLNMQEADITEVIDLVAKVTGRTFIIDPRVRGKVTVISDKEMTKSQIYETFLATLEVYGFSAVQAGDVTKIIGQSDIKSAGIEVETQGGRVGEEIITRVFPIQNASAMELVPILRPMVANYGHLAGVPSANVLIVADRATNIDRLSEIVYLLDKAGSEEIEVVNLQHAWVGAMITLLERISPTAVAAGNQGARSGSNRTVTLVGDERSNRIIVKGETEARQQIIELIQKLDTPSQENASYKVIFLNNADAVKMAEILKGIASTSQGASGQNEPPSQPISVLADEEQNALIVRAEPSDMKELESIISQLDIPREQVLIEAAIVEVTGNDTDTLGVQWATNPEVVQDGVPFLSVSSEVAGASVGNLAQSVGQGISQAGGSPLGALTSVPAGTFMGLADPFGNRVDFGVAIQALESASNTNFLSTPSILTLDNSEAVITVGNSVPFKTGGSGDEDNPFTIERQDVGTTLTVIPHIQQNGTIRLEVDQIVESVDETVSYDASDVVTKKRQVTTQVLVNSGETIVLGGLIQDQVSELESRVPVLGYIPIIGHLFKSKSTLKTKTNLLIILKPSVIEDNMDEIRANRLNGVWELRIQTIKDESSIQQPSVDDIFEGNYINGSPQVEGEN
ncbi:type II secretion system secretin GspD [Reinekea blandensis]|uniref:Type II secretory pathway, component PulD n=1 Tax=Reinekea blandensis MED297 TaxID=314283 RepID=A4BES0_9GAMM|nr:type II secretion system secretin GspD [Reinekea blandensis]EAR09497.1 Type II secretory pathway, component PulD [Reinekea sp. MED297] [Reinekea blandensis MED297]